MDERGRTIALTGDIIAAYVSHNAVPQRELPDLIRNVHLALNGPVTATEAAAPLAKPTAAQIRRSITPEALISFVDGKPYKILRRHLSRHGMSIEAYKARYGLPPDYPTTAPVYSAARSSKAKASGLGKLGRRAKAARASAPQGKG